MYKIILLLFKNVWSTFTNFTLDCDGCQIDIFSVERSDVVLREVKLIDGLVFFNSLSRGRLESRDATIAMMGILYLFNYSLILIWKSKAKFRQNKNVYWEGTGKTGSTTDFSAFFKVGYYSIMPNSIKDPKGHLFYIKKPRTGPIYRSELP